MYERCMAITYIEVKNLSTMPVDVFQLVEAMVISFILIATVIFFAHFISRYGRTHAKGSIESVTIMASRRLH